MAVRKTTRKATGTRGAAAKKAPAAKKSSRKKTPSAKRTPAKKATKGKVAKGKGGARKKTPKGVSSTVVNLGNLFALRPRINTSFRQEDFLTARRSLEEESYATLEVAARAVAERALELSNDPSNRRGQRRRR